MYIGVVQPSLSYNDDLHNHYYGISFLLYASLIATLYPFLSYMFGSWLKYYGGIIPLLAKYKATVLLSYSF